MTRPNFLIISADQHRGDCLGIEGRKVRTPNLDRLAGQGTRFTAAICPSAGVPAGARLDPHRAAVPHPRGA